MNKDELVKIAIDTGQPLPAPVPFMPPQTNTAPAPNTDGVLARLEQKLDKVLELLSKVDEDIPKLEELPF